MFGLDIMLGYLLGFFGVLVALFGAYSVSTGDGKVAATAILFLGVLLGGYGFAIHPAMAKERFIKVVEKAETFYEEQKVAEEANQKDIIWQVNRVLRVNDSLIVEKSALGKYEIKSTGKLYSVHVDTETNELMYIVNNGEFIFEAENVLGE